MTFRRKALLAQAPLGVALLLLALLAMRTTRSLGEGATAILDQNYRSVLAAQRMRDAIDHLDRAALARLLGRPDDPARRAAQERRFADELAVEEGNITEAGEAAAAAELRRGWSAFNAERALLDTLPRAEAEQRYVDRVAPAADALRHAADRILALNQDAMVLKSEHARREAASMSSLMIGASLAALGLGLLLSSLLTGRLVQPLAALRAAADRIGGGDFSARVPVEGGDELAQLGATFNGMADRLDRYRRSSLGELLLAQQAAQAAIDSLPDPVVVFDAQGDVLIANRAAETVLGIDAGAAAGVALAAVEPPLRTVIEQARAHVLGGKGALVPRGFEDAVRRPLPSDGDTWLLARATPVYGEGGGVTGATVLLQDVTRLHRFDQLKNDLVATVAHEFRTPLTSLHMAVHLCLEQAAGPLTERQADLLFAAREDCERLQRIVDELLDLARLRGGGMQLRRQPLAVAALVGAALDAQRIPASEAQVALAAEVAPDLPAVSVDEDRLLGVLANLLVNAVRHAPAGSTVVVAAREVAGGVRVEVRDAGPGIDPARREQVFERFTQGGAAPGGAGLGLSIAREIVTAHGGTIGVDSEPGRGSTFWFTLPV